MSDAAAPGTRRPGAVVWTSVFLGCAAAVVLSAMAGSAILAVRDGWGRWAPMLVVVECVGAALTALHALALLGPRCKPTWALRIAALSCDILGAFGVFWPAFVPGVVLLIFTLQAPVRDWYLAPQRAERGDPRPAP